MKYAVTTKCRTMGNMALTMSLFVVALACQKPAQPLPVSHAEGADADQAYVRKSLDRWLDLYNAERYETLITTLYAEHAVLLAPHAPLHHGREEILHAYQQAAKASSERIDRSDIEDLRVSGNLAVAQGEDAGLSTPRNGGEPTRFNEKWLMVLERQPDSTWKVIYEMWNDNNPASEGQGT